MIEGEELNRCHVSIERKEESLNCNAEDQTNEFGNKHDRYIMLLVNRRTIPPRNFLQKIEHSLSMCWLIFSVMLSSFLHIHSQFPEIFELLQRNSCNSSVRENVTTTAWMLLGEMFYVFHTDVDNHVNLSITNFMKLWSFHCCSYIFAAIIVLNLVSSLLGHAFLYMEPAPESCFASFPSSDTNYSHDIENPNLVMPHFIFSLLHRLSGYWCCLAFSYTFWFYKFEIVLVLSW